MYSKHWYIGLLILSLFSCDQFVLKKENKDKIIKEGLEKLSWNEVEQPPLFEVCKQQSEEKLEWCFRNTITKHIQEFLTKTPMTITTRIEDTIWVPLLITKEGRIILEDFTLSDTIINQIPDLKNRLEHSIDALPKVQPAHTRSTPVTTRYKLPLIIHLD